MRKSLSFSILALFATSIYAEENSAKASLLYSRLDPTSLRQHLAFYKLFSGTPSGQKAWKDLERMLGGRPPLEVAGAQTSALLFSNGSVDAVAALLQAHSQGSGVHLPLPSLQEISALGTALPNRRLLGHAATTKEQLLALPSEEIDLARALLLCQLPPSEHQKQQILYYEALLDLLALQIQVRLPHMATPEQKILEINRLLFHEMHMRFPVHSLANEKIDLYSFLPSVLDSQRGVCLGVSTLYLCLAQRLELPLQIITPPGHIYVRYCDSERTINIETTARGIDIPSEQYHTVDLHRLTPQPLKAVIGMTLYNRALLWHDQGLCAQAIADYQQALLYMPEDVQTQELLAFAYLSAGQEEEARRIFSSLQEASLPDATSKLTTPFDYLHGRVDRKGIELLVMKGGEDHAALVKTKDQLAETLNKFPYFRDGWLHLAMVWLSLGRQGEALAALESYHHIDATHPVVEYYLASLHLLRYDYVQAWRYLVQAEKLTAWQQYQPNALRLLRSELQRLAPGLSPPP